MPSTRNYPNKLKRNLGRGEAETRLIAASWRRYSWRDLEELADRLESEPPGHAAPIMRKSRGNVVEIDMLPDDTPGPLDPARLAELQAHHPDVFDLTNYEGDQSRQDLALANVARNLGWPPDDAWALIIAVRGDGKAYRRDYIERTLGLAYAEQDTPDDVKGDALFDLSQDGLALDMGRRWARHARFVKMWDRWLFWDGTRWLRDETLLHVTRTREYLRARADAFVRAAKLGKLMPDEADREKVRKMAEATAKTLRSKATVSAVVDLVRSHPERVAVTEQWDADPWLLGTPGGTVDLRTGIMRKPDPEDYITKLASVAPAPARTKPALWLKFLERITDGDAELQGYFQRFAGYALTGSTREHTFNYGHGTGANGKSVCIEALKGILGEYACSFPTEMLMVTQNERHPTEVARMRGCRLAIGSETEEGRQWAESQIKKLTGGDTIAARFMHKDFFEYQPQFKLFIVGNHKPGLRCVDEAMQRRLHFIPFLVTIPPEERDKDLSAKLKAEWPAILRWAIDGCLAWQRDGLAPPPCVLSATDEYLSSEDAFKTWQTDCLLDDVNAWSSSADLWQSWRQWAEGAGEHRRPAAQAIRQHGSARLSPVSASQNPIPWLQGLFRILPTDDGSERARAWTA